MIKKVTDEWVSNFNAQKKGNVCLGILNGTAIGIVDTNVLGGNETPNCFSAFWLCFCQADFSTNMAWMTLGGLVSRVVEACS